ncbi:hypothetical protein DV738_g3922, partial [Chaetothyriales sp. CBS 135597]
MACLGTQQPCWILDLPRELKLCIVAFLERKRDLYNLCLTSRAFEDAVLSMLYASLDFEVPQQVSPHWRSGDFLEFRPHVYQAVRSLSIRNGPAVFKRAGYKQGLGQYLGCPDCQVRLMVDRIPRDRLNSFSFMHRTPLSFDTLESLSTAHFSSLRKLCVFEIETTVPENAALPVNLQTLECRAVGDGKAISRLLQANKSTLRRLLLGQEREVVEQYAQARYGFLDAISQPSSVLLCAKDLQELPQLQELDLCGLDLRPLVPTTVDQGLEFYKLTRLSLESCPGTAVFLGALADAFSISEGIDPLSELPPAPQLQHFLLRNEMPTAPLKEALSLFLASFKGLRTLSLLLENASLLDGASSLIAEHGLTLTTLVLESRIQPRESLALDTSRPFGMDGFSEELWDRLISDTCRLCPNLTELGTGFPWSEETIRLRKSPLPTLKHLKTIHVRNFPESQVLSQLGDYSIKEYATKFLEWVYPPSRGGTQPRIETIAIGPTLYESRWNSNARRQQPPEYLQTHYFCIDFGQTRFGRWSPMITPISQKYMNEICEEKHLGAVFEPVWLR